MIYDIFVINYVALENTYHFNELLRSSAKIILLEN